jgi:PTS system nitrogen regulatory IIA component
VFLIVSPTVRAHLQMLAHVARALLDPGFRAAIDRRAPAEELAAEAERIEEAPPAPPRPRGESGAD